VANREQRRVVCLLLAWVLVQSALLYSPLALQRRLSLGLFVPLAALAALGLAAIPRTRWRRILTILALASAIPSNLIVIAAGLGGVARAEPLLVQSDDESCGLTWLAQNAEPGSLVLAGETVGNRIPAFASVRVVYGHPFETPNANKELAQVESLYSATTDLASVLLVLESRGVDFVYFGPEERALGPATWPEEMPAACACGQVIIARVRTP
jgi:4-amino-4-deoxy-L-arabinose transferase-like glycosyltransferase